MTLHLLARPQHPATPASSMVWKMLFDRQHALLHRRACPAFLAGVAALGLRREELPHFGRLSQLVYQRTGWTLRSMGGPLPEADYYASLARRELPLVTRLRTFAEFDRPTHGLDLFSEVLGRLPLLLEPDYAAALQAFGQAWELATTPAAVALLRRFARATFELGLLAPVGGGRPQFYGTALLTSAHHLHTATAADATTQHLPLAGAARHLSLLASPAAGVGAGPTSYFVAQSWTELLAEVEHLRTELRLAQRPEVGSRVSAPSAPNPTGRGHAFAARTSALRQAG
jgi:phenylalanine-4-hydroxylase